MAIYKRTNSKYYWMKFTFDGELVQQTTKCTSKIKAREVEAAFRHELVLGRIGIKPKVAAPSFDSAAEDFLKWSKVKHQNPVTYNRYHFACQTLIKFFGKTKVDRIEASDVEKFVAWRSANISRKTGLPISRETLNRELLTLKIIFNRLIEDRVLQFSPARSVKGLPQNERKFHVISNDEEKLYLMACPPLLQDVAAVMIETGMRPGEVYRVRRDEVNLTGNYLQITRGKTKTSIRRVYMNDKVRRIIELRMGRFKGVNLFPKKDIDKGEPTTTLDHRHQRVVSGLGFDFRLYDARHTFASRAVGQDINLVTLAAMLGHSSLRMVMRYAHPSENEKQAAVKIMQSGKRSAKAV